MGQNTSKATTHEDNEQVAQKVQCDKCLQESGQFSSDEKVHVHSRLCKKRYTGWRAKYFEAYEELLPPDVIVASISWVEKNVIAEVMDELIAVLNTQATRTDVMNTLESVRDFRT